MEQIAEFRLLLIGILVEATPFLVMASLISFLFELFVPEETIGKTFAGKTLAGVFGAAMAGFVFPLCECCIVPIARKLADRGVPLPVALTLMIAAPSYSPVVLASTSVAFSRTPCVIYWRVGLALAITITAGIIFSFLDRHKSLTSELRDSAPSSGAHCCHCHNEEAGSGPLTKTGAALEEAIGDFLRMLAYLVMAAIITATIKVYLPVSFMKSLASSDLLAVPGMMIFAFITSTCSDADPFIAAAMQQFSEVSKMAFLLLGPVIDLKLVMMHFAFFPKRIAVTLLLLLPALVTAALLIMKIFH